MGIFSDYAMKYYEAGYSVIPLYKGEKSPCIDNWSKYCEQMPTEDEIENWEKKFPDSNIGFCLGKSSKICAVDFDMTFGPSEEIENFLLGYLPPTPLVKKGKKGWSRFYKYNGEPSKRWNKKSGDTEQRMIDFLSHGLQTVVPPSIHPETKQPYVWLFEDATNINVIDLPSLPNGFFDVCEKLASDNHKAVMNMKEGRHDKIIAYGFAIIEQQPNIEALAEKLIEYDKRINKECQYFLDRKYFKKSQEENAMEIARKVEKTISRVFEKKRNIIGWKVGKDVPIVNIETAIEISPGFYDSIVDEKGKERLIPDYVGMANSLHQAKVWHFSDKGHFVFNGKFWDSISESNAINKIVSLNKGIMVPTHLNNFLKGIQSKCFKDLRSEQRKTFGKLNLSNGVLDVITKSLADDAKDYFFTGFSDISYNPNSKCPLWEKTLEEIMCLDTDRIKTIQQMFGYILLGGRPFLEKSFALMGDGRNGKSVVLGVLKKILGKNNFSSISLSAFSEKFETVMLDGKICNISTDEGNDFRVNAGAFKRAVSGEELIVQQKGQPAYPIDNIARFVFACNEMPYFGDRSHAMMDRIILINFDRFFLDDDRNTGLIDELSSEIDGILNWSLFGASEVLKNREIYQSKLTIEEKELFFEDSDPVKGWIKDSIKITEPKDFIPTAVLYDHFRNVMRADGHAQILSKIGFARSLNKILRQQYAANNRGIPPQSLKEPHLDGKTRIVRGIKWSETKREVSRLQSL